MEPGEQSALIRSRNYLDLDNQQHDERLALDSLSFQSQQQREDPSYHNPSGQYVNVDTQTEPEPDRLYLESDVQDEGNEIDGEQHFDEHSQQQEQVDGSERKLALLRDLLDIERRRNEQRKANNDKMQKYLAQLQTDYLRLQRDLVEALELGHKVHAQKEAQLEAVAETIKEKDRLIEKLKANLESLDETKLREEFKELLAKQNKLTSLEKKQLREQIETVEQQLVSERVSNSQTLQQFQNRLDDQLKVHQSEISALHMKLEKSEKELERLLCEPKNLVIKSLKEEKSKLASHIDELNLILEDNQTKYESLKRRLECLLGEQEQVEIKNQEEIEKLQQNLAEQRRTLNETKLELDDREEVVQIVQFNLQRSERRVKNLITALKGKETTYKELINEIHSKHDQERDKLRSDIRFLERKLIENECEVDKKQNEIIRIELEHANQLESIRNDRDQRLNKINLEKQKTEKELQTAELKLAHELDDKALKMKLIEQLQKESHQFKEESKRLSIELTKCEAKLHGKQQELNKMFEVHSAKQNEIEQHQSSRFELEEARKHSKRLEVTIEELRSENAKINLKLRLNEARMTKIDAEINREHAKMVHEYEKKLEQIKAEQSVYDRNKVRYKRYGYKLKKYCEHLRRVHEHLCNPGVCGYIIGPIKSQSVSSSGSIKRTPSKNSAGLNWSDEEQCYDSIYERENTCFSTPSKVHKRRRFSIKRTSTNPSVTSTNSTQKAPLKINNLPSNETQVNSEHRYYYIDENSFANPTPGNQSKENNVCRTMI